MQRTPNVASAVITLLAKNPSASRRAQSVLQSLLSLEPLELSTKTGDQDNSSDTPNSVSLRGIESDDIDKIFSLNVPGLRKRWDSVASVCPRSGTIFHLISLSEQDRLPSTPTTSLSNALTPRTDHPDGKGLALISITPGPSRDSNGAHSSISTPNDAVRDSRRTIASHIDKMNYTPFALACKLSFLSSLGRPINASDILGRNNSGLPLIKFPNQHSKMDNSCLKSSSNESAMDSNSLFKLKEIVLPHFDDASYDDGKTLLSTFSESNLKRPLIGLYQWPSSLTIGKNGNGVAIRPLPAAKEDMSLPSPTFVFYCESLHDAVRTFDEAGALVAKVGFRGGLENSGQLMVQHDDLKGLDVRICEAKEFSKFFAEAQESLLAGSLDELQNVNVLTEGGNVAGSSLNMEEGSSHTPQTRRTDAMNGLGDCWVEFRANMKHPSGFFKHLKTSFATGGKKKNKSPQTKRVAKAPDIPYE